MLWRDLAVSILPNLYRHSFIQQISTACQDPSIAPSPDNTAVHKTKMQLQSRSKRVEVSPWQPKISGRGKCWGVGGQGWRKMKQLSIWNNKKRSWGDYTKWKRPHDNNHMISRLCRRERSNTHSAECVSPALDSGTREHHGQHKTEVSPPLFPSPLS